MANTHKLLCSLSIYHAYFTRTEELFRDFTIKPTQHCLQQMRVHGLSFKAKANGFRLFYLEDADTADAPARPWDASLSLSFGLYLTNPRFHNITNISPGNTPRPTVYHYSNRDVDDSGDNPVLNANTRTLSPRQLSLRLQGDAPQQTITLKDQDNNTAHAQVFTNPQGLFAHSIALQHLAPGHYAYTRDTAAGNQDSQDLYLSDELARSMPFAIIELDHSGDDLLDTSTAPVEYELRYTTRSFPWTYHVSLSKDYTGHTIAIKDARIASMQPADEYPLAEFVRKDQAADLAKGNVLIFQSADPDDNANALDMPVLENPNEDLTLNVELPNNKGTLKIEKLPNPPLGLPNTNIYLTI